LFEDSRVLLPELFQFLNAARSAVVHRDEIVVPQKKVDVERGEPVLLHPVIDAVKDDVQVAVVALDLRIMDLAERVFDGERMKLERLPDDLLTLIRGW